MTIQVLRVAGISILCFAGLIPSVASAQPPVDPVTAALDRDGDGTVSAEEIQQAVASLRSLDKNADGKLSFAELRSEFPGGFEPPGFDGTDVGPPGFGGPGFGPPGLRGGRRGPRMEKRTRVSEFDTDSDGRLNRDERTAARDSLNGESENEGPFGRRGRRGPPGGFGPGGQRDPATPGPQISPDSVPTFPNASLYEPTVMRTLFLEFEHDDWSEEMAAFKDTDVDVPAKLIVDGQVYPNVGVHFRGMSSFSMVPENYKRSLNVSLDFVDDEQRLYGYRTLNLLNCAGDASMMSAALYSHLASKFMPVAKANFVRVVINGESWGVFANLQQFNKDFVREHFDTGKGSRWKVRGNPGATGGLEYFGDKLEEYTSRFQIKGGDDPDAWQHLIELCRVLNVTPADELEAALRPILDIDEVLWFLALDVALVNSDGYWTRASDYSLYRDTNGRFHTFPADINEAFHGDEGGPGGPGRRGGPGGRGGFPGPSGGFGPPRFGGFGPPPGFGPTEGPANGTANGTANGLPLPGQGDAGARNDREGQLPADVVVQRGPGGFRGPPNHGGIDLDPLVNPDPDRMPLRTKLLAVPHLQKQYLQNIRTIARAMDWQNMGPVVTQFRQLIQAEVQADTRKLTTYEGFVRATREEIGEGEDAKNGLRYFFEARSKFLLEHPMIAALPDAEH